MPVILNWRAGMKVRWVGVILNAMNEIQRNFLRFTTPYLLVHGGGDQLVKIDGSRYLHENSSSNGKTNRDTRMSCFADGTEQTNSLSMGISDE